MRRDRTGESACNQTRDGECKLGPLPEPDPLSVPALELFLDLQSRWDRGGFSGERRGISRSELEIEARARGIDLCEYLLDDFKAMEAFIHAQDIERIESTTTD